MTVRIVTDSACDLPDAVVAELGIGVVPLMIRFGETEYVDREELSTDRFYELCEASDELPSTAAPSPGRFEEMYRTMAAEGATAIVSVHLSGELSATLQSARTAAAAVADTVPVTCIDTRSLTGGLGIIAVEAAELAQAGGSAEEVAARVEELVPRTKVIATLDTLENLKKGGRIGAAQAALGSLLSVKPLIAIVDGAVEAIGRQRTRKRALDHLVNHVAETPNIERLAAFHGNAPDFDEFLARIRDLHDGEILTGEIGAVIGAHGGPRTLGVIYHVTD